MKKLLKNIFDSIINSLASLAKKPEKKANFYSFVSKHLKSKPNSVEFDEEHKFYWFKYRTTYLYADDKPTYNFSKVKLESDAERICCKFYKPKLDDIILDIGAGVGTELNYFITKIGNNGKIYNIEASPSTFNKLDLLTKKNNFTNCFNFNIAISNQNGKLYIEEQLEHEKAQVNTNKNGIEIQAITFDTFITNEQINKISFIKVNIEGAEFDMIDGMEQTIKITENIAISCHDFLFENNGRIKNKVIGFLKENNFEVQENSTGHKVVDSWIYGKKKT